LLASKRWRHLVAQGQGHLDISAARLGLNAEPQTNDLNNDGEAQPIAAQ